MAIGRKGLMERMIVAHRGCCTGRHLDMALRPRSGLVPRTESSREDGRTGPVYTGEAPVLEQSALCLCICLSWFLDWRHVADTGSLFGSGLLLSVP